MTWALQAEHTGTLMMPHISIVERILPHGREDGHIAMTGWTFMTAPMIPKTVDIMWEKQRTENGYSTQ